jgi:hypothetical protein
MSASVTAATVLCPAAVRPDGDDPAVVVGDGDPVPVGRPGGVFGDDLACQSPDVFAVRTTSRCMRDSPGAAAREGDQLPIRRPRGTAGRHQPDEEPGKTGVSGTSRSSAEPPLLGSAMNTIHCSSSDQLGSISVPRGTVRRLCAPRRDTTARSRSPEGTITPPRPTADSPWRQNASSFPSGDETGPRWESAVPQGVEARIVTRDPVEPTTEILAQPPGDESAVNPDPVLTPIAATPARAERNTTTVVVIEHCGARTPLKVSKHAGSRPGPRYDPASMTG